MLRLVPYLGYCENAAVNMVGGGRQTSLEDTDFISFGVSDM